MSRADLAQMTLAEGRIKFLEGGIRGENQLDDDELAEVLVGLTTLGTAERINLTSEVWMSYPTRYY